ncbi:hypothetical protein Pint_00431 [Pistacia integerrima]|uniref:Uncharacterized protein n=1 Tax=Pistacia integerrima TaxID=434235 RepID=A0ACC0ZF66_9ROSI|nr:hypothetical protein Pint_00431 [Pistacia integerrima]
MSESQTAVDLPILDISQPLDSSSLSSISEACKTWGFFLISNHGISKDVYTRLSMLSKQLFGLPSDTKLELGPLSSTKTYTPHFIASPFFESLRVAGPNFFASAQSSANILFDQQSLEFSEILQEYGSKMTELSKKIIEVILAPDEVVGEGNMKLYKPFVCLDYLKFRENNVKGKFEKVGFTVKDFAGIRLQI